MRLARFARVRLLRHALPISLLILRKKPTALQSTQTGITLGASRLQFQRSARPFCFAESKIDYRYKEIVCKVALVTSSVMYGGSEPDTKVKSIYKSMYLPY